MRESAPTFSVLSLARVRGSAISCMILIMLMMACYVVPQVYLSHIVATRPVAEDVLLGIAIYMVLGFLAHPLTYAASMLQVLWRSEARRGFYEGVYARTSGRVAVAAAPAAEKPFAALISANGQELVSDCVDFIYNSAQLLFSSLLSVTLISAFIMGEFAVAYLITLGLCALLYWWLGNWTSNTAAVFEKAFNRFVSALPEGWLANTLGERLPMARFMRLFERRWQVYRQAALAAQNAFQGFSLLQAVCIWAPTMALVLWRSPEMSTAEVIALAVVMPQLIQTLVEISQLLSNVTFYLSLRGRVAWLNAALEEERSDLAERCDVALISLRRKSDEGWQDMPVTSVEEIASVTGAPGRYALSGPNGCGKTSLLLHLKAQAKERAFMVPAEAFLFPAVRTGLSLGQRKLKDLRLSFEAARGRTALILLDEWDANLDPVNREIISALIDELAREHAVVEVSHHAKETAAQG